MRYGPGPPSVCQARVLPIGTEPWGLLSLFSDSVQEYDDKEIGLLQLLTSEIDFAKPYEIYDELIPLHLHCGIALSPGDGIDAETLERNVAVALGAC